MNNDNNDVLSSIEVSEAIIKRAKGRPAQEKLKNVVNKLNVNQRNLVNNLTSGKKYSNLKDLIHDSGYRGTSLSKIMDNKNIMECLRMISFDPDLLGSVSSATALEIQLDPESSRMDRLNAASLGAKIAGLVKQVNINNNTNVNTELGKEDLLNWLKDLRGDKNE